MPVQPPPRAITAPVRVSTRASTQARGAPAAHPSAKPNTAPSGPPSARTNPITSATEPMRLNKRMAELGLASRREADEWIERGWVSVNGQVASMGQKVLPTDHIEVQRAASAQQSTQVTILMHKPVGYVSGQPEDGHQSAVVLLGPQSRWKQDKTPTRFSPQQLRGLAVAGRLDIDSTGLLVLTQDGRVARALIGEDAGMEKEYLVRVRLGDVTANVQAAFPREQLERLRFGLSLDGKALKRAQVDWQNPEQLRFVLTEGKKRQIRRMCEQVGLFVTGLKRVRVGSVRLGDLPLGQWRYLGPTERF